MVLSGDAHHGFIGGYPPWFYWGIPAMVLLGGCPPWFYWGIPAMVLLGDAHHGFIGGYPPWFYWGMPTMVLLGDTRHGFIGGYPPWFYWGMPTMVLCSVISLTGKCAKPNHSEMYPNIYSQSIDSQESKLSEKSIIHIESTRLEHPHVSGTMCLKCPPPSHLSLHTVACRNPFTIYRTATTTALCVTAEISFPQVHKLAT